MGIYITCVILILLASLLIILSVLAQNPKSGMAANFGASNQVMGVRQTSDFLEKFTWGLAIAILFLSLGATMSIPKSKIAASSGDSIDKTIDQSGETNTFEQFQFPGAEGENTTDGNTDQPAENPQE